MDGLLGDAEALGDFVVDAAIAYPRQNEPLHPVALPQQALPAIILWHPLAGPFFVAGGADQQWAKKANWQALEFGGLEVMAPNPGWVAEEQDAAVFDPEGTFSKAAFEVAILDCTSSSCTNVIFLNPFEPKLLMNCIARASFAHIHTDCPPTDIRTLPFRESPDPEKMKKYARPDRS